MNSTMLVYYIAATNNGSSGISDTKEKKERVALVGGWHELHNI
jgi:hypothetical protein